MDLNRFPGVSIHLLQCFLEQKNLNIIMGMDKDNSKVMPAVKLPLRKK